MFALPHLGQTSTFTASLFLVLALPFVERNLLASFAVRGFFGQLLHFDVLFRISRLDEERVHILPLVALQENLAVLRRSAARAVGLHFFRKLFQIRFFAVQSLDDGHGSAEFPCFRAHKNFLLLFADFATNTNVLRKPAYRTNFNHYFFLGSLYG